MLFSDRNTHFLINEYMAEYMAVSVLLVLITRPEEVASWQYGSHIVHVLCICIIY